MSDKYREELTLWAIRTAIVVALTVLVSLIQRHLGIAIEAPPPPPITVVVQPQDGAEPKVAVFPTPNAKE